MASAPIAEVRLDDWSDILEPAIRLVEPDCSLELQPSDTGKIRQELQIIIDSLPTAYRYIVLADATAKDRVDSTELIAEELEIPAGTVRVYRNRAMIFHSRQTAVIRI